MTNEGPQTVASGAHASVAMLPKILKDFQNLDATVRATLSRIMKNYAEDGPESLPPTQFKSEGRFPVGDKKRTHLQIQAFKGWQVRVYGALLSEHRIFICSEIDIAKKQDKADRDRLARAAKNLAPYV